MKAVVYDAPRTFEIRDIPLPQPAPGELRIKVNQVGICGTDLHIHEGEFQAKFPLIPGHELVGWVDALGEGVEGFAIGEQVTVNPNLHCGYCEACRAGRLILCANLKGFGSNFPGFFAEYTTAPAPLVFSAEGIHPDAAVFTEPLSCACHGLDRLEVRPGSSALVLGSGPTGLLLAQLIRIGGASRVTVAAPKQFKLDVARGLGIDATVLLARDDAAGNLARLKEASPGGRGYDVVVEATGSPEVGNLCVPLTADGGTVLVYGVTKGSDLVSYHPFDVFRREITIRGSFAEVTSFGTALAYLRSGRVSTQGIISHRFPLDSYATALSTLATDPTAHKVVITA